VLAIIDHAAFGVLSAFVATATMAFQFAIIIPLLHLSPDAIMAKQQAIVKTHSLQVGGPVLAGRRFPECRLGGSLNRRWLQIHLPQASRAYQGAACQPCIAAKPLPTVRADKMEFLHRLRRIKAAIAYLKKHAEWLRRRPG